MKRYFDIILCLNLPAWWSAAFLTCSEFDQTNFRCSMNIPKLQETFRSVQKLRQEIRQLLKAVMFNLKVPIKQTGNVDKLN